MPRYHFNIFDGSQVRDTKGMDLPDRDAAWKEATLATGELLNGFETSLRKGQDFRMEVTDEFENPLWEIQVHAKRR